MAQSTSSLEFAPPNDPGGGRAFFLSVCVHVLLLMALTWGVTWRNNPPDNSVEAELWSVVPEPVALKAPPPPAPEPKQIGRAHV